MPGYGGPGFLINDTVLMDVGTETSVLSQDEQKRVSSILLTHCHFDHIKDIPSLAENRFNDDSPVQVISIIEVLNSLKTHILNNTIWPDFTSIPEDRPVLTLLPVEADSEFHLGDLFVKPIKVNHTVAATGFLVSDGSASFFYTGDMGPTETLWEILNGVANLRAVLIETSYPNGMEEMANLTGHLTPDLMAREVKKMKK